MMRQRELVRQGKRPGGHVRGRCSYDVVLLLPNGTSDADVAQALRVGPPGVYAPEAEGSSPGKCKPRHTMHEDGRAAGTPENPLRDYI